MRKIASFAMLLLVTAGLSAQEMSELGLALRYESAEAGLYATHRTHPFGTKLMVTNLLNETELEVQVGGRPAGNSRALIEISSLAADFLGIEKGVLTQVKIVPQAKTAVAPAMRTRLAVKQTGNVVARSTGEDLVGFHPSIALDARVTLTNTANNQKVTITIKGRIQASKDRVMEISSAAARALGIRGSGEVHLETAR
jgi:rare lipoprotein A (peptidoglycan hydrolase)